MIQHEKLAFVALVFDVFPVISLKKVKDFPFLYQDVDTFGKNPHNNATIFYNNYGIYQELP